MTFLPLEIKYPEPLHVVGVNHRTMSIAGREALARISSDQGAFLKSLQQRFSFKEGACISTCNRFEIVALGENVDKQLSDYLVDAVTQHGVSSENIESSIYCLQDRQAVRHLFRVASSLDSMALGEAQILGQVKDSYHLAVKEGCVGRYLHSLFQFAFRFAKKVRGSTLVGAGEISISYVAVKLAQQLFGEFSDREVLLIGSGTMAEITALHMKSRGCRSIIIANRTVERAADLASRIGGSAVSLEDIDPLIDRVDMVISSIRADLTIIEPAQVKGRTKQSPLFLIDLGVPRNLSPALADIDGVYLYSVDDLARISSENQEIRQEAAKDAEIVIEYGIHQFESWILKLASDPGVLKLRALIHEVCLEELRSALPTHLDGKIIDEVVAKASYAISQRIGHQLTEVVRALPGHHGQDQHEYERLLSIVFDNLLGENLE